MTEFLTYCSMVVVIGLICAAIKGELAEYIKGCLITIAVITAVIFLVMWRAIV